MDDNEVTLVCNRLEHTVVHHPAEIVRACAECGAPVLIFPSGQRALKTYPQIRIVCALCVGKTAYDEIRPAPGAVEEMNGMLRRKPESN